MPNPRFFNVQGPFSLQVLAKLSGCVIERGDESLEISNVAPLDQAGQGDLTFLFNKKYLTALDNTKASVVIVEKAFIDRVPSDCAILVSETPYRSFAQVSSHFYPEDFALTSVHPTVVIHDSVVMGENVSIAPNAVIHEGAKINDNVQIGANAVIDRNVEIGSGTKIGANAYMGYCVVGQNCEIHPGVRVGTRGFGFAMDQRGHIDVPQIGGVIIGNTVEIGANTTVDRGAGPDTIIGDGTKIDNLVQIGHNVQIGKGCVIVAQSGIAGSTVLEDYVIVAAKVGIAGHLRIGKGAQIAAMSGVMRNVEAGSKVGGAPAVPAKQWMRQNVALEKLVKKQEK